MVHYTDRSWELPLVRGWLLGAYLLIAFTLTGVLLNALLLRGLLLPAMVHVLPRFILRRSTGRLRSWAIVPPPSNTGLTYPDRLTSAYVRALA